MEKRQALFIVDFSGQESPELLHRHHRAQRWAASDSCKHSGKQQQNSKFQTQPIHLWVQGLELHSKMKTDSPVL